MQTPCARPAAWSVAAYADHQWPLTAALFLQAKNLLDTSGGVPTLTGFAVRVLQDKCPDACVLYSSATGISEPHHMAYMTRLGAFGFGDIIELITKLKAAGLGASELFACGLKASGIYLSRCAPPSLRPARSPPHCAQCGRSCVPLNRPLLPAWRRGLAGSVCMSTDMSTGLWYLDISAAATSRPSPHGYRQGMDLYISAAAMWTLTRGGPFVALPSQRASVARTVVHAASASPLLALLRARSSTRRRICAPLSG